MAPTRLDLAQATAEEREALARAIKDGARVRQETTGIYWIWKRPA